MDLHLRIKSRILLLSLIILLSFITVALKTTLIASKQVNQLVTNSHNYKKTKRLDITDRNGTILATSLSSSSAYVHPKEVDDKLLFVKRLAEIFPDLDKEELIGKLTSGKKFVWIKKLISPETERKLFNLGQPGLYFGERVYRFYPKENLASHLLGYTKVKTEGVNFSHLSGISGVESAFDEILTVSKNSDKEDSVSLSIDLSVQSHVETVLSEWGKRMNAKAGSVIIMDIRSGEIIALASSPDYNPNKKRTVSFDKDEPGVYFNRAIQGVYEMGSTFKIFSVAQGLEENLFDLDTSFSTQPFLVGKKKFKDKFKFDREVTVREIIVRSSNVGSARIALKLGKENQKKILKKLGLLDPVPFELKEAKMTTPLNPPDWKPLTLATVSFGHSISVSLLHLARAYSILTNGGFDVEPTIVRKNEDQDIRKRIFKRETSQKILELLEAVVRDERGTGRSANSAYYGIGGKTGTADKPSKKNKGYLEERVISNFAGVFPIKEPRYVIAALLDEPENRFKEKTCRFSGCTVAPMVKQIIERVGPLLGVIPFNNHEENNSDS
ncbi:hypothetical protein CBE37_04790 [bacterium TMED277]|nr:MAG: hypothetical protein CBE37_04790 [bacterium TMED277]